MSNLPPSWLKPGVRVNYHALIGGPVTARNVSVCVGPYRFGGEWVVWLDGYRGCVHVAHCVPADGGAT